MYRAEIGFLLSRLDGEEGTSRADGVHVLELEFLFNVDETAYRLVPEDVRIWALGKQPEEAFIDSALALPKSYTTLLCGCCADGSMLDAVINWKSSASSPNTTKRKTVMVQNSELSKPPNPNGPFVRQYIQPDTHWTTAASFMFYIDEVIYPRVVAERKRLGRPDDHRWVVTCDCAAVHVSASVRARFNAKYKKLGGILAFIPPLCTDTLQPLDIGIFGPLKAAAKSQHSKIIINDKYEHLGAEARRERFTASTRYTRAVAVESMNHALSAYRSSAIFKAWGVSLGNPSVKTKPELEAYIRLLAKQGEIAKLAEDAEGKRKAWLASLAEDRKEKRPPKDHGSCPSIAATQK